MSDLRSCRVMAVAAATLLLGACSSSGEAPQKDAAHAPDASVQKVEPAAAPAPVAVPAPPPAQPAAGLRVFIDPVTGKPREPTAAEIKALEAASPPANQKPAVPQQDKEIVFPDGTVAIQGHTLSEMKACVQKDGHVVVDHDCKSDQVTKP